ncbi:tyrosine serine protein [Moniliophthora roreri MCA 2997]|uniref:Tyrosine serine protein n=1 Tax=Moniliophthora roreri (strain MCA 2997) TaxID=1381753 RepID=V2Y0J2_MONRO|nr:tyrosine serine protein [Moniliophthora roreri MCA 2997]
MPNVDVPLESIHNFRDVGHLTSLPRGLLYRSGRLDEATPSDIHKLSSEYQIKTVIDLRTKSEHIKQEQKTGIAPRKQEERRPWETIRVHFIGRRYEVQILKELGLVKAIWLLILMILQLRMAAIRVVGRDVLTPKGLEGLNRDMLIYCRAEILQALEILVNPSSYPVLIHCTQGKDRSGLIVMLVLFALRVPLHVIKSDYVLSQHGLDRIRDSMREEVNEIGMTESYMMAPESVVDAVWAYLEQEYGGAEGYLDAIGFGEKKRTMLKAVFGVE